MMKMIVLDQHCSWTHSNAWLQPYMLHWWLLYYTYSHLYQTLYIALLVLLNSSRIRLTSTIWRLFQHIFGSYPHNSECTPRSARHPIPPQGAYSCHVHSSCHLLLWNSERSTLREKEYINQNVIYWAMNLRSISDYGGSKTYRTELRNWQWLKPERTSWHHTDAHRLTCDQHGTIQLGSLTPRYIPGIKPPGSTRTCPRTFATIYALPTCYRFLWPPTT